MRRPEGGPGSSGQAIRLARNVVGDARRWHAEPVSLHPGKRSTWRVTAELGGRPVASFVKFWANDIADLAGAWRLLAARAARGVGPSVPSVASVDVRKASLVLSAVPGHPLHQLGLDAAGGAEAAEQVWRRVGESLCGFHEPLVGLRAAPVEVRSVERWASAVVDRHPDQTRIVGDLVERFATRPGPSALVPIHGSLRTDQLLVGDERIALVDLDGAGLGDPATDLANLIAYLGWRGVRRPCDAPTVSVAVRTLAATHPAVSSASWPGWLAHSVLKIAGRRCLDGHNGEWRLVPHLLQLALDPAGLLPSLSAPRGLQVASRHA